MFSDISLQATIPPANCVINFIVWSSALLMFCVSSDTAYTFINIFFVDSVIFAFSLDDVEMPRSSTLVLSATTSSFFRVMSFFVPMLSNGSLSAVRIVMSPVILSRSYAPIEYPVCMEMVFMASTTLFTL